MPIELTLRQITYSCGRRVQITEGTALVNRNGLYLIIAVLAVIAIGLGVYVYREESKPGIDIRIGQDGVSVEEN